MRGIALIAVGLALAGPAPVLAQDPAADRSTARQCAGCHGIDGIARRPDVPHIAGESPIYLRAQMEAFRRGSRHHAQMTLIARGLSESTIEAVIRWYSSIEVSATVPES